MLFTKIREVKSPRRANVTDAGIDFFIPEYDEEVSKLIEEKSYGGVEVVEDVINIPPGAQAVIPSGIKVIVDEGQALVAFNKSGIATKKGLVAGPCVVDRGYEGEVHLGLINTTKETQTLSFGQKALQLVQLRIDQHIPVEVTGDEYEAVCEREHTDSTRGDGGFGSTSLTH